MKTSKSSSEIKWPLVVQSLTKAIIFELFYYINGYFMVWLTSMNIHSKCHTYLLYLLIFHGPNLITFSKWKIKDVWFWNSDSFWNVLLVWMGFKLLWLSWSPAKNNICVNICIIVYMRQKLATFGIYEILGPTFAAFRPTQQKTRHKLSSVVYCRLLNYYSRAIG